MEAGLKPAHPGGNPHWATDGLCDLGEVTNLPVQRVERVSASCAPNGAGPEGNAQDGQNWIP